ncbi:hypothetical protein [Rhizosphaericola mali]|uniref:Uncharacterized protein n=1 Tax=Rhizosphaericola mali TaxID=2545455 RepID=A0A5P2FUR6_9BACT|nr:hypothetical protein [Rhizosphaericola mali]QES87206.1 hypothetical protein E0W69_000520 [Rhizosphaericola mali]
MVFLDANSVVPQSFHIDGVDTSYYTLDYINAFLIWKKAFPNKESVTATFRVFPYKFTTKTQRFSYDSIININIGSQRSVARNYQLNDKSEDLFNFGNIDYNGSFGRSISFGNSQDAVFNSQFNLQMNGYIGDSIQLAAALTDNNLSIQPDGTTQQLNEFDQILIQFKKRNWEVDLGDIDLRQNNNYFLSFYKRLQGVTLAFQSNVGKNIKSRTIFNGAIAKGKFARNVLAVTDGNQGPYPLTGNNNETYFVVLAGTEKVFMDGVQLQRGQDQDYVIDYNTAQITFTSKTMISSDKRIQVEFEYADRNYLNSMVYVGNETQFGNKLKVNVAAYTNNDAKNSPINQTLDTDQKQFLADLGDSINKAYYQNVSPQAFDATLIMYRKTDTIVNGIHDSVFVYTTDSLQAKYAPSFISVGTGNGDYVYVSSDANGKVYQWVAPVNSVKQGNYVPAQFLVTPKKQQIVTTNIAYQLDKNNLLQVQLGASKYDVNTFSEKDKGNDNGIGTKLNYTHLSELTTDNHHYNVKTDLGYEYENANFRPVERLRPVEFSRDWGLPILADSTSERIASFSVLANDEKKNQLQYQLGSYTRGDGYKGIRNTLRHVQMTESGWTFNEMLSLTNMTLPDSKGYYLRPTLEISKMLRHFHNYSIGVGYLLEKNKVTFNDFDSINQNSYAFETITAFIKSDMSKTNNWTLSYYTRKDWLPTNSILTTSTRSDNLSFTGQLFSNKHNQFKLNMTYRQLHVSDTLLTTQKPENTLLGRLEYNFNEWNGLLVGNAFYEIGSGQEQKREFSYIQVQAGQGQYTWIDYNNDGVAQLNEFEIALYKDQANYIRLYTPSGDYVKADYTQLNYSFLLNPSVLFDAKSKGMKKFARRFNLQSSLQTNKKNISQGGIQFNPLQGAISDSALLDLSYIWSNTLSFNRNSTVWGADVTNILNYDKSLLTYGSESNQLNQWTFKERLNINRIYTIAFRQDLNLNKLSNPSYSNRNYSLKRIYLSPSITYTAGSHFRILSTYEFYTNKNLEEYGGEKAVSNAVSIESKYNSFQSMSLSGKFTFNQISFNGDANSTVGYTMLGGLLAGKNLLWNVNFTKRLLKNLELTFQYDGRKPAQSRTVHIGTATIRAVL